MKPLFTLLLLLSLYSCHAQPATLRKVGGPCEGCEALYEYGSAQLTTVDTLPGFRENAPHQLLVTGTVYQADGKTPAAGIILYIYHTDRTGIYPKKGDEKGWAKHHGYLRGWVKTDASGRYTFYTFRPASYPNSRIPQHIHLTVKEPDTIPYYLDDYLFTDDPFLTPQEKARLTNRGGSGVVSPLRENGISVIRRDLFLGLNIPGY